MSTRILSQLSSFLWNPNFESNNHADLPLATSTFYIAGGDLAGAPRHAAPCLRSLARPIERTSVASRFTPQHLVVVTSRHHRWIVHIGRIASRVWHHRCNRSFAIVYIIACWSWRRIKLPGLAISDTRPKRNPFGSFQQSKPNVTPSLPARILGTRLCAKASALHLSSKGPCSAAPLRTWIPVLHLSRELISIAKRTICAIPGCTSSDNQL